MINYDDRVNNIMERTTASMYSFWSAMLTAHTVLLSVAVALPSAISTIVVWQFKLVGVMATFCMVVILINFAMIRIQYDVIGRRLLDHSAESSEVSRSRDIKIAKNRHKLMRLAEYFSAFALAIEAVLVTYVLLT